MASSNDIPLIIINIGNHHYLNFFRIVILVFFLVSVALVMNERMMRRFIIKRPEILKRKIGLVGLVANYTMESLHKKWSYEDHYIGNDDESKCEVFAQLS